MPFPVSTNEIGFFGGSRGVRGSRSRGGSRCASSLGGSRGGSRRRVRGVRRGGSRRKGFKGGVGEYHGGMCPDCFVHH